MKKLLILALCLIMCAAPLAACSGGDGTTAPGTEPPETTYDYDKIPEVIEPHEEKSVTADELGFKAAITKTEKYWVADAKADKSGNIKITSYNPGTTVITVTNSYSETVDVTVTVGLDYSIDSVEFDKFEMPEVYVYANEYGVKNTNGDNAAFFQAAIDAVAKQGGGTVYVPKGIYKTSFIQLKDNITLRLEGVLEDYNTPFTSLLGAKLSSSYFAVITAIDGKGDLFANHEAKGWGREGADNFAIIGGCIDMIGQSRAFIWCCADGVLLENVIMKDCRNDHAIQITGSKNVTIRNCMFAGYNFGSGVTGSETIQIESTSTGAIGDQTVTASKFDPNEYINSENVVIENCYFGKSDKFESHTYPIGHHGHPTSDIVRGLKVINCTFDNPRIVAIRAYAYSDFEIAGCEFISTRANSVVGEGRYMIELTLNTGNVALYKNGPYLTVEADRGGCRNLDIHDNVFTLNRFSQMGGILHTLKEGNVSSDAVTYVGTMICENYKSNPQNFTGYKLMTNRMENIHFYDNELNIDNKNGSTLFNLASVKGLLIENNTINSSINLVKGKYDAGTVEGAYLSGCTSADHYAKNFIVYATSDNTRAPIVAINPDGDIEAFCTAKSSSAVTIHFKATEGGVIERRAEDNGWLYVEPIADEGYEFDGYYVNGAKVDPGRFEFSAYTTFEARFVAIDE